MAYDKHLNFAYSTVSTAPSPDTTGTSLQLPTGGGANFPAPPFNVTLWPINVQPISSNAEVARVTSIGGDVMYLTRAQESSPARAVVAGDQVAATITSKTLVDIETETSAHIAATASVHGLVASVNLLGNRTASGAYVQYGLTGGLTDGDAVTYPVAFPTATDCIVVTPAVSATNVVFAVDTVTKTGFHIRMAAGAAFYWLAIGH